MPIKREPLIIIVDKNAGYRKLVVGCLRALGIKNLKTFENGEQCYTSKAPHADLVILDYNLGEENWNGLEFMEEYERENAGTMFLFLSSNTNVDIAVESVRKGALDYILKSKIGLTRLVSQVEKIRDFQKLKLRKRRNWNVLLFLLVLCTSFTIALSIIYIVL